MIILDANGNPIGRGDGLLALSGGLSWTSETPELLARLPVPEIPAVSDEVAALRRKYLDATAALCEMAGIPYTGKLTNVDYEATMAAADAAVNTIRKANALGTIKATLGYCRDVLSELEGASWWENITGV